jgi:LysM repeat protein
VGAGAWFNFHQAGNRPENTGIITHVFTRKPFVLFLLVLWLAVLAIAAITSRPVRGESDLQSGPVQTLAPNDDGSITHVIRYGETLVDISQAYGITLQELYNRNRALNPAAPAYFEGQILVIRPAFTATPVITQTYTPNPPTRTLLPTRTPRPTHTLTPVRSAIATRTPTPEPLIQIPTIDDLGGNRQAIAYTFIGVSVVGLLALLISTIFTKNR